MSCLRPLRRNARVLLSAIGGAVCLLSPHPGFTAEVHVASRPLIGLALSGGGARGAAHIGVLKVLESLRVPVDCITGTSMGSIIGGAYAAGVGTAELEQTVLDTDWDDVFNDRPPRAQQALRRKAEAASGLSEVELGLGKDGVAVAAGLVSGVQIESFLRRLTRPVADVDNFSDLPIPFRAIATDIETGEAVLLADGSLPQAMRASMAIPGAMTPVEIGGRLLVDGGITDNLPINQARRLCADVVIAVNIQSPLMKRGELDSAFAITAQLINMLGKSSVDEQLAALGEQDVLIEPELGDISASSFDRQAEAIGIGADAARALAERLARYSLRPDEYAAVRARQQPAFAGLGVVDAIRFEGLSRTRPEVLDDQMESRPGEPLSEDVLAADMRRIYGRGDFEAIDYRIQRLDDQRVLVVSPREKRWGPGYLGFGLGLGADFAGESYFNTVLQYRRTWLNERGAEWILRARGGRRNELYTEFYQPVDDLGRFFLTTHAAGGIDKLGYFVGDQRIATYKAHRLSAGVDFGVNLGSYGQMTLGPFVHRIRFNPDTGSVFLPGIRASGRGVRLLTRIDQLDRPWLPTEGYALKLEATYLDEDQAEPIHRLEGRADLAFRADAHVVALSLAGGTDLNSGLPGYELFSLGGPLRLSAYEIGALQGERYAYARVDYRNRAMRIPSILGSGVFLGGALEVGQMNGLLGSNRDSGLRYSASLYLAADTALGPAYLGFAAGDEGRKAVYLMLGMP